jgi:3-hydroxyisobutyrate dehydrogenase-like beta-hydroxyacid dehydrogenase
MTDKEPLTLLGLGAMGTALARSWIAAGHPLTVWNRTPRTLDGATVAATAAEAVAANRLVVTCLLDGASVDAVLAGLDLTGTDLVDLTTGTPGDARARADAKPGRFLDGAIMAVPPMIGTPGASVLYSGDRELFDAHRDTLAVPADPRFVGADPGHAALHDVALLSAMDGMFAGTTHAYALIRSAGLPARDFAPMLVDWLTAMLPAAEAAAEQLDTGDYTTGVTSSLAMQVAGNATLLGTAAEQGVSAELLQPWFDLMARRLADGHGQEDTTGVVELLLAGRNRP